MTTTILASLILDPEKALDLIENSITWYKPMPEAGGASAAEIIIALAEKSGLNPDSFIGLEEMLTATIRRIWLNQSAKEAEKNGGPVVQITGSEDETFIEGERMSLSAFVEELAHADRRARRQRGYTKIYYSLTYPDGRELKDRYDAGSGSKDDLIRLDREAMGK